MCRGAPQAAVHVGGMLEVDVPDMPMGISGLGEASGSIVGVSNGPNDDFRVGVGEKERAKGA